MRYGAVKVKICGVTNLEDALNAAEFGADMIGFNFYPKSARYLKPHAASAIAAQLPSGLLRVGVFVNLSMDEVSDISSKVGLDVVQLHGDEDDNFIRIVSHVTEKPVIKAFRIDSGTSVETIVRSDADAVLLDSGANGEFGGSGKTFDWNRVSGISDRKQAFLAGGLTPENVVQAIRTVRPYAVDVASGVEMRKGKKDPSKLKAFIANAKNA